MKSWRKAIIGSCILAVVTTIVMRFGVMRLLSPLPWGLSIVVGVSFSLIFTTIALVSMWIAKRINRGTVLLPLITGIAFIGTVAVAGTLFGIRVAIAKAITLSLLIMLFLSPPKKIQPVWLSCVGTILAMAFGYIVYAFTNLWVGLLAGLAVITTLVVTIIRDKRKVE